MSPQTDFIAVRKSSIRATTTDRVDLRTSRPALIPTVQAVHTFRGDFLSACSFPVLDVSIEHTLRTYSSRFAVNVLLAGRLLRCDGACTRQLLCDFADHSLGNC
jgi:hypothetical protein